MVAVATVPVLAVLFGFGGGPWLLLVLPAMLLGLWATWRVKATFQRYAQVGSRRGLSGADVARLLLRGGGLADVKVERVSGFLSDHYDPTSKTLRLSEATHDSHSVAAIGVAAHEAGHAFQHAEGYSALAFRSAIVPLVSIGSHLLMPLILLAVFSGGFQPGGNLFSWGAVAVLAAVSFFSLVTLPVEFDASKRALAVLGRTGILAEDELAGARSVLGAAAWTYVASAIMAIAQLLYYLLPLLGGGRREE
ncbi:MAG: zinc metallopeptidase [Planctomycetes bacterium]|nr:zinc metallopeptidase [Planctomycetota bacterium]